MSGPAAAFPLRLWEHDEETIRRALRQLAVGSAASVTLPDSLDGTVIAGGKPISLDGAVLHEDGLTLDSSLELYEPGDLYRFTISQRPNNNLRFVPVLADESIPDYTLLARPARFGGTIDHDQGEWWYEVWREESDRFVVHLMNREANRDVLPGDLPVSRVYSLPKGPMRFEAVYDHARCMQALGTAPANR